MFANHYDMKKFNLALLLILVAHAVYGYEVSTEVQKKRVLLEEFTGIYCTYCPTAHTIAATIARAHSDEAYIVGIHSSSYAAATGDDPDFRTEEGDALSTYYGVSTYPSGMVNRGSVSYYYYWIKNSKSALAEDAPLNLWIAATYDNETRLLTVDIEGYYTAEVQESLQCLNVVWTQSNITGTQSGSTLGSDYVHNHVLRDYITPLWGDTLATPTQGSYFTKSYSYELPTAVTNIEVKPEDIEVIAFVAANKGEVLQVAGTKPTYLNYETALAATLTEPLIPISTRYGFDFFEVTLDSYTTSTITEATFEVTINSVVQQVAWSGELAPFASVDIVLPIEEYESKNINSVSIALVALNGESITCDTTVDGVFSSPTATTPTVKFVIKTDGYADENRFLIKNSSGEVVTELGGYEAGIEAEYEEWVELDENAIYCIEIQDTEGDGMQSPSSGYIQIYNDDNSYVTQNYSINDFGGRTFFTTTTEATGIAEKGIESVFYYSSESKTVSLGDTATPAQITLISTGGDILLTTTQTTLSVAEIPTGIYLLQITQANRQTTTKIAF